MVIEGIAPVVSGALAAAVRVRVVLPLVGFGAKEAVTPWGRPLTVNWIGPCEPLKWFTVMRSLTEVPGATCTIESALDRLKSGCACCGCLNERSSMPNCLLSSRFRRAEISNEAIFAEADSTANGVLKPLPAVTVTGVDCTIRLCPTSKALSVISAGSTGVVLANIPTKTDMCETVSTKRPVTEGTKNSQPKQVE